MGRILLNLDQMRGRVIDFTLFPSSFSLSLKSNSVEEGILPVGNKRSAMCKKTREKEGDNDEREVAYCASLGKLLLNCVVAPGWWWSSASAESLGFCCIYRSGVKYDFPWASSCKCDWPVHFIVTQYCGWFLFQKALLLTCCLYVMWMLYLQDVAMLSKLKICSRIFVARRQGSLSLAYVYRRCV